MKFEPRYGQAVGRIVIRRPTSTILRADPTKGTTKYLLLDAVGPDCEARGLKVGDVVVPIKINSVVIDNGTAFRPFVEEKEVALIVRDWASLDEFHVQTENAAEYVPFSDPKAALPLGAAAAARSPQPAPENGVHP